MMQSENNHKLKRAAAIASVGLSLFLIVLKAVAFWMTASLAILSSLVDSVTDLFASFISFVAIYFSTKPATQNHRYGYGKSEALSALVQAIFVGLSGLFVIIDGIHRLIYPIEINQTIVGLIIMLISIVATVGLVLFQTYVAKKTNSLAIKADRAHYTVDFLTNSTVILSLVLVHFLGFSYFDVIAALFISTYLLYNAYKFAKESIDQITDKELDNDIRENIINIVKECTDIRGLHDLRSRSLGDVYYFELHLEIDGSVTLAKAHEMSDVVEEKIRELYPNSQILIHQDPYGIREDRLDHHLNGRCEL